MFVTCPRKRNLNQWKGIIQLPRINKPIGFVFSRIICTVSSLNNRIITSTDNWKPLLFLSRANSWTFSREAYFYHYCRSVFIKITTTIVIIVTITITQIRWQPISLSLSLLSIFRSLRLLCNAQTVYLYDKSTWKSPPANL